MDFNVLVGGSAGQGIDTLATILEKIIQRKGYEVFTIRDYMSRVRGGHNFTQIRFSDEKISSHDDFLDLIIALDEDTIKNHASRLKKGGFVVCDTSIKAGDINAISIDMKGMARDSGNTRTSGSVAVGAVLKILGFNLEDVESSIEWALEKSEIVKQNFLAITKGFDAVEKKLDIKEKSKNENLLMNGNEAIALGAMAANCKFYSAYPMTPSTSIMNYIASKMRETEIVVEQAEDEIASINMAIGASYAGVRSMTGTSGGGFSLMVEALGLSGMMEVPLVVANVQRPGPVTGLPTRTEQSDLKFVISASQGEFPRMVIAVKNPEDAFQQTVRAFNLADKYQIPVILLSDQFLSDYTTTIKPLDLSKVTIERHLADKPDKDYIRYKLTENGISPRIIPGKFEGCTVMADSDEHDEKGYIAESGEVRVKMMDKRMKKLEYLKQEIIEPEFIGDANADTVIVGWGSLQCVIKEAVDTLNKRGVSCSALVFGDVWPLPQKAILEKAEKGKKFINVEQNATGQLASLIREVTGIKCEKNILKYDGRPISANEIVEKFLKLNK